MQWHALFVDCRPMEHAPSAWQDRQMVQGFYESIEEGVNCMRDDATSLHDELRQQQAQNHQQVRTFAECPLPGTSLQAYFAAARHAHDSKSAQWSQLKLTLEGLVAASIDGLSDPTMCCT